MTNDSIYPRLSTKSVPWLAGFPLTGTRSLIKTGRSPANMARPSFSQQTIERSGGGGTSVPQEQWHPMDQAVFVLTLA